MRSLFYPLVFWFMAYGASSAPTVLIPAPLGLPPVPIPADNIPTAAAIALGSRLYFAPALSFDSSLSCATCHNPRLGFSDARPISLGIGGKKGTRNSPTLLNSAYNKLQFWDGRAATLEAQASVPMMNSLEMAHSPTGIEKRLSADPQYQKLFTEVFGPGAITMDKVTRALASFERSLLSGNSPFDRHQYGNDPTALNEPARRGLAIFKDPAKGNCVVCHTAGKQYALFNDNKFHNLGVGLSPEGELTDLGRYTHTKRDGDQGAFKTPTLRNVAQTAPYMHDGSLKTLKEVVDFYVGGGSSNPYRDKLIRPLTHLTKQDRADLVAFLESLTGAPSK